MDPKYAEEELCESVTIPTLPSVVQRINQMLLDPEVGLREIGAEVAKDAPIATKVLRIANSAFYGLRERVISTEHASCVLGMRVLKNIVMQASVIGQFKHLAGAAGFDVEALWRHAILSAETAQRMAQNCRADLGLMPEEFHSAGLLHDVGQVVLLDNRPEEFLRAVQLSAELGVELHMAEKEIFGFDHASIGARVAERWGLPNLLVAAIGQHHRPSKELTDQAAVTLIALTNSLCEAVPTGDEAASMATWDPQAGATLGLEQQGFLKVAAEALKRYPSIEV
jgi:putative nucleotidyltransferase with HDIG domain